MNRPRQVSGDRLRKARNDAGMTQAQLARAAGVSERNIVRWENNQHTPRIEHLIAISKATGTPMEELYGDDAEADRAMLAELHARIAMLQRNRVAS